MAFITIKLYNSWNPSSTKHQYIYIYIWWNITHSTSLTKFPPFKISHRNKYILIKYKLISQKELTLHLLHNVFRKPIVLHQFLENCLANFGLLWAWCTPKFIKTYIEPFINFLMNCMISTNSRQMKTYHWSLTMELTWNWKTA